MGTDYNNPPIGRFYLLADPPALTDHDSFTFNVTAYDWTSHGYGFHLYPGSSFNMSACWDPNYSGDVNFCFIEGKDNYNQWLTTNDRFLAEHCDSVVSMCGGGEPDTYYDYSVQSTNNYYYGFYRTTGGSDRVNAEFEVYRTKLAVNPDSVLESCSAMSDRDLLSYDYECTVYLPLHHNPALGLVSLGTTSDTEGVIHWNNIIDFSLTCHARLLIYVLISVAITSVTLLLMLCVCLVACCFRGNKKTYTRLHVREEDPLTSGRQNAPPLYSSLYGSTGSSSTCN